MLVFFHRGSGLGLHVRIGPLAWEILLLFPGKPLELQLAVSYLPLSRSFLVRMFESRR